MTYVKNKERSGKQSLFNSTLAWDSWFILMKKKPHSEQNRAKKRHEYESVHKVTVLNNVGDFSRAEFPQSPFLINLYYRGLPA